MLTTPLPTHQLFMSFTKSAKNQNEQRISAAHSLSKKYFRQADQTIEKVARWPFLHPEAVRWYRERVKKGQNDAKIVGIRCPDDFL